MPVKFLSTNSGISDTKNATIGRFETPIKAIIMKESDLCSKNNDLVKALFSVQKSNKFGESVVMQNDFDIFAPTDEGGDATADTFKETASKFIKHATFKKQFNVSLEMMEDANYSLVTQKAKRFARSYYKTRNLFASKLLTGATAGANGNATSVTFGPTGATKTFDITTADGKALFSAAHTVSPNRFHHVGAVSTELVAQVLTAAVCEIRNMKDENNYSMGYTADTVVIPCDDHALEAAVKKVLGSEFGNNAEGALSGSINLHYGNWTLIVDPLWTRTVKTSHPMIVFSSEARDNLMAAPFFDRKCLTVNAFVDQNSLDYVWTGAARWSAGFVTHKWACLVDLLDTSTTALFDSSATGTSGATTTESIALFGTDNTGAGGGAGGGTGGGEGNT